MRRNRLRVQAHYSLRLKSLFHLAENYPLELLLSFATLFAGLHVPIARDGGHYIDVIPPFGHLRSGSADVGV
jgi:hypothetical protein